MPSIILSILLSTGCRSEPAASTPSTPPSSAAPTPSIGVDPAASPAKADVPAETDPVTDENWSDHPKVTAAQALAERIDLSAKTSSWRTETVKDSTHDPSVRELIAAQDERGQIRRLTIIEVSGELSRTTVQYYDDDKVLRLVKADDAHAASEALYRTTIFFDATGEELHRRDKRLLSEQSGPSLSAPVADRLLTSSDAAKALMETHRALVSPGE